jgi:hypothetical protein
MFSAVLLMMRNAQYRVVEDKKCFVYWLLESNSMQLRGVAENRDVQCKCICSVVEERNA